MLFEIDPTGKTSRGVAVETLAGLGLRERYDLQEWVIHAPEMLGEPLLVITAEFARFDRTSERLDVLALDRKGKLVVVELKRSAVGTAAELQALRYAAYCSTLLLEDVVEMHQEFIRRRGTELGLEEVRALLLRFVDEPDFSALDDKPRIILAAEEFPPEMTATVLWLRSFELDVSCVRLRPYRVGDRLVVDSSVLIPLPEARDYLIRRERKEVDQAARVRPAPETPESFIAKVPAGIRPLFQEIRDWLVRQEGIQETAFTTLLSYRMASDRRWLAWLQFTKSEVRTGLPPELEIDPSRVVRTTANGWPIVGARTAEDLAYVRVLLEQALTLVRDGGTGADPTTG
jgi:hypothetical protein